MKDTRQVRAMDDYFHSLLLDESHALDIKDINKQGEVMLVTTAQRQSQVIPEAQSMGFMESDARFEQLSELLAQVAHVSDEEIETQPHLELTTEKESLEAIEPIAIPAQPINPIRSITTSATEPSIDVVDNVSNKPASEVTVSANSWENIETGKEFQALFFEVAGMTFAVPLTELGGIHQLTEITPLFGQPAWFKGLINSREHKINVVDTAQWVIPEQRGETEDYSYLIVLGESRWGLACHHLKGTELLHRDQVKWRHQEGRRPWLAGMVKEKMCALLHVKALLLLLERGVNIEGR
ncbi:chemotaxis protein CheW [Aeromonas cavernicola]|uniref:Chemotaxis protein CheW n=1 Tax=Aeromonas cavernicola TaxID=1006623 RepID=A0A2H9U9G4_9GAMM|nr:chemotaxis protein CheW [Aeromonas cavernicola]PJG60629.1 chemotaxis protein CheW [Aeromonas cavernicola]